MIRLIIHSVSKVPPMPQTSIVIPKVKLSIQQPSFLKAHAHLFEKWAWVIKIIAESH
jgi:hypothetical protein